MGRPSALEREYAATEARFAGPDDVPLPEHWGGYRVEPEALERLSASRDGVRLRECLGRLEEKNRQGIVLALSGVPMGRPAWPLLTASRSCGLGYWSSSW